MNLALEMDRTPVRPFEPMRPMRNGVVQTLLTTTRWDLPDALTREGAPILVDAGPDETGEDEGNVRLLAYFTPASSNRRAKGAAILMHGWEGCSHSTYNLVTARELSHAGYHVFRLNLRDHGPGYHVHPQALNRGVFLGTLLAECVRAAAQLAGMVRPLPVYLVGFSMGGNFALRAAIRHKSLPIPNLRKVVAVNPAINPLWSTQRIDSVPAFRRYFREPWLAQLRQKERFFPNRYDFRRAADIESLVDLTAWLVRREGLYPDAEAYFADYAVLGNATAGLSVATQIITSRDDLIVPVADFYGLAPSPLLKIELHAHGGHVGYMEGLPPEHRVGVLVRETIEREAIEADGQ